MNLQVQVRLHQEAQASANNEHGLLASKVDATFAAQMMMSVALHAHLGDRMAFDYKDCRERESFLTANISNIESTLATTIAALLAGIGQHNQELIATSQRLDAIESQLNSTCTARQRHFECEKSPGGQSYNTGRSTSVIATPTQGPSHISSNFQMPQASIAAKKPASARVRVTFSFKVRAQLHTLCGCSCGCPPLTALSCARQRQANLPGLAASLYWLSANSTEHFYTDVPAGMQVMETTRAGLLLPQALHSTPQHCLAVPATQATVGGFGIRAQATFC